MTQRIWVTMACLSDYGSSTLHDLSIVLFRYACHRFARFICLDSLTVDFRTIAMAFWAPPSGPPPMYGPPPSGPPPMYGPPPPQPAMYGSTRYHYHTRDGGPPNDGKPPAAPGGPPSMPPYGFAPAAPGAPFGAPPAQAPMAFYAPPPPYQSAAHGYVCCSTGSAPAPAPAPAPVNMSGAIYAKPAEANGHAPGSRVNGRLAKVDDGSGVLLPEETTTFHVFEPGIHPEKPEFESKADFKVLNVDSHWTVKQLIRQLGGFQVPRLHPEWVGRTDLIGIQEWHPPDDVNIIFTKGTNIMYNEPKANCTLTEMGWGAARGKAGGLPPVWVVLYP